MGMRIPTIERQIGPAPVPAPRYQPAEAIGAGEAMIGRAMERVGQMVFERAKEIKARDDKTRAMELYNDFAKRRTEYIYGENGIMSLSGPAARGAYDRSLTDLDAWRDEYLSQAENDDQRYLLQGMLDDDIRQSTEEVSRHEAEERQKTAKATFDATLAQAESDVALAAGDPTRFESSLRSVEQSLVLYYNLDPNDPGHAAFLTDQMQIARGNLHLIALDSMIKAGNYRAAQAWFDAHKGEIPGDKIGDVAQAIREGMKYITLQEKGAEIVATYDWRRAQDGREHIRKTFEGAEEENMLAYCEKLWDEQKEAYQQELKKRVRMQADALALRFSYHNPKACYDYIRDSDEYEEDIKEPLLQEMKKRFDEDKSTFPQMQSDTYDAAIEQIAIAKSFDEAEDIINKTGLKQELKDRLIVYAADKFNRDLDYPGAPQRTDERVFANLIIHGFDINPKTGKANLLTECPTWEKFVEKYGGKIDINDRRYIMSLYRNDDGRKKNADEIAWGFNQGTMLSRMIKDAGIEDPLEYASAWQYVMLSVATIEANTGKKLTPVEFTKLAKESLETHKVWIRKRGLFGIDILWPDVRKNITAWKEKLPPGFIYDEKRQAIYYKAPDGKLYKVEPSYFE